MSGEGERGTVRLERHWTTLEPLSNNTHLFFDLTPRPINAVNQHGRSES